MRLLVLSARAAIGVCGTGTHTSIHAWANRLRRIRTFPTPSPASVAHATVSRAGWHVRNGVVCAIVPGTFSRARLCKAAAATPVASSHEAQQPAHVSGLRPEVTSALVAVGAEAPTSVQIAAAPVILSGRDAWLACETGSGKTLAYLGPLFSLLRQQEADATSAQGYVREPYRPRALIMAPTVELVEQIAAVAKSLSHHAKLRVLGLDAPQAYAARRLAAGVDLVVGTPGRVRTMRERGVLFLSRIEHVVLDEADTLLDESFAAETLAQSCKPELASALRAVERRADGVDGDAEWDAAPRSVPKGAATSNRPPRKPTQLIAVGATLRRDSYEMLRRVLPDMVFVEGATPMNRPPPAVRQKWMNVVHPDTKLGALLDILRSHSSEQTLVFCNKSSTATFVTLSLVEHGMAALSLHGDLQMRHRRENVRKFRRDGGVLVATDLGARGLDFPDVGLVVLYEPPLLASEYLHRVGRTGRANRKGLAITLVGRKDSKQADIIRTELARSSGGGDDEFRGVLSSRSRQAIDRQVAAEHGRTVPTRTVPTRTVAIDRSIKESSSPRVATDHRAISADGRRSGPPVAAERQRGRGSSRTKAESTTASSQKYRSRGLAGHSRGRTGSQKTKKGKGPRTVQPDKPRSVSNVRGGTQRKRA